MVQRSKDIKNEHWEAGSIERPSFGVNENDPIRIFHRTFPAKQQLRYDMHYPLELGIGLTGRVRRYYRDGQIDVEPGEVWVCGMWEPHGYRIISAPCEMLVMIIHPSLLSRMHLGEQHEIDWLVPFCKPPKQRSGVPKKRHREITKLGRSLIPLHNRKITGNQRIRVQLKLLEILLELFDIENSGEATLRPTTDSIDRIAKSLQLVFDNKNCIRTKLAAKICGMNRNSFAKLFRETMGIKFSEFGLRYRTSSAPDELLKTNTAIKAIAANWGFTDASHLHRCFREHYNCSPAEYRKASRERR